jgi:hypothetical protein
MKHVAALLAVALITGAVVGCGSGGHDENDSLKVEGLERFDALSYQAVWNGDPSLPGFDADAVSEDEWKALVEHQRKDGILALSESDRRTLLQGAVKAYLSEVESTRRTIEAEGKQATVSEWYGKDDAFYIMLMMREELADGIFTTWGDFVYDESGSRHTIQIVTDTGDDLRSAVWSVDSGKELECAYGDDGFALAASLYYGLLSSVIEAVPAAETTLGEMSVVKFTTPESNLHVWLERQSLFPVRIEYGPGTALGEPRIVTLQAVNNLRQPATPTAPASC